MKLRLQLSHLRVKESPKSEPVLLREADVSSAPKIRYEKGQRLWVFIDDDMQIPEPLPDKGKGRCGRR